mmetsp:Transcript_20497/g.32059  ORF Transcript_20497/g.32059 Transcript_20497/m.32059 type:complete len:227 (+) Transcript_20497:179-859(+)|eukprot:CAMPEP_0184304658 /NCGR_PEP_ID=MMETSP1049-20130417/14113_1 /TAXON_ID=77928 /ORGANISM="Proteomonas sulcata, Strain CCMP704" /LENGTH=226 /DNA_ID=CAMNT_0026616509 /DNA_START=28 /DNA_END=708 /DNA_ORIENTATION=+
MSAVALTMRRCAMQSARTVFSPAMARRVNHPAAIGTGFKQMSFLAAKADSAATPGWTPGPGVHLEEELELQKARTWDEADADKFKATPVHDLFKGKKVVLFAVPGAFTGVCHKAHVPSFSKNLDAFKAKGVDSVICVSVNDPYCMNAWKSQLGDAAKGIDFYSDHDTSFTRWMHADKDLKVAALGPSKRSNRYAMIVEDGTIKALFTEESPGDLKVSDGDNVLKSL